jgi:hypothetical protein
VLSGTLQENDLVHRDVVPNGPSYAECVAEIQAVLHQRTMHAGSYKLLNLLHRHRGLCDTERAQGLPIG